MCWGERAFVREIRACSRALADSGEFSLDHEVWVDFFSPLMLSAEVLAAIALVGRLCFLAGISSLPCHYHYSEETRDTKSCSGYGTRHLGSKNSDGIDVEVTQAF